MADPAGAAFRPEFEDPQVEYRAVEPWAVGGLILGLLSALSLFAALLWLLPAVGIVANLVALRRLASEPGRPGRVAALVGLGLSVMFGVAPLAQKGANYVLLSRQGSEVADQFLEYLRQDSPEKALTLRFSPDQRPPIDELLWTYYRNDNQAKQELIEFVNHNVVRQLLALGERAQIRFYKTAGVASEGTRGIVSYWYTVTFPDDAIETAGGSPNSAKSNAGGTGKSTFFIAVTLERNPVSNPGHNPWRMINVDGGFNPSGSLGIAG